MRYAISDADQVVEAIPGTAATCPTCSAPVVAKCGHVYVWHWAHTRRDDCDPWSEPDSQWHHAWQQWFSKSNREVTMGPHRADVAVPGGVLELQHSHLSVPEIGEREAFYRQRGWFAWLFDATDAYANERLNVRTHDGRGTYRTFRWKHARKSIAAARCPVYLDLGDGGILRLGRIHPEAPVGGWGHLLTPNEFVIEFAMAAHRQASR